MDLVKIGFLIQTNGLEKANKEVDSLLDKTSKIGTVSKKAAADAETSQKKVKKATEDSTKAADNNAKAVEKTSKALEKQKIIGDYLGKGLDKTTATSIANFKQLGASVTETSTMLNTLANNKGILQTRKDIEAANKAQQEHAKLVDQTIGKYRQLSSKSLGGGILDTIEQENKGLQELRKHYSSLEKQQEKNLSVVKEYEAASRKSFGGGILDTIGKQDKGLQNLNAEYRAMEVAQSKLLSAEKQANAERQKAIALEQTKAKYIKEGFGKGSSTQLAKMELSGADVTTLDNYKASLLATSSALGSFAGSAKNATEEKSKLAQQVKGIAFYAVLSTAIYGAMTAMTALTAATVRMADEYTAIQNRMKLYIDGASELAAINNKMAQMSIENNVGLRETATLYARLLPAMQRVGANTAAVTNVVDAFGKSIRIGGATAMEAASATIQFSQAMASGKLAGDEFRSISEASPRFLKAIADGSGIAAEKLKEMSSAGKLTTEVISKALLKEYPKLIEENKKLGVTLEQGANAIKTGFLVAIGEFNEGAKLTQLIGEAMTDFASKLLKVAQGARDAGKSFKEFYTNNAGMFKAALEAVKFAAVALASYMGTKFVIAMALAAKSAISSFLAISLAAKAYFQAVAMEAGKATAAVRTIGMLTPTGIVGALGSLALTAVGVAYSYYLMDDSAEELNNRLKEQGEIANKTADELRQLTGLDRTTAIDKLTESFNAQNKAISEQQEKVDAVLFAIRAVSVDNEKARKVTEEARRGTLSYSKAIEELNKLSIPPDLYLELKNQVDAYNEVTNVGGKYAKGLDNLGESVELQGNAAQNAILKNNQYKDSVKSVGDEAVIAGGKVKKLIDEMNAEVKSKGLTLGVMQITGLSSSSSAKLAKDAQEKALEKEKVNNKEYLDALSKHKELIETRNKYKSQMFDADTPEQESSAVKGYKETTKALEETTKALVRFKGTYKTVSPLTQLDDALVAAFKEDERLANEISKLESSRRDTADEDRKKVLDGYNDEILAVQRLLTLLSQGVDSDVARIAATKEYSENVIGLGLAQELVEARRSKQRADYAISLGEETEMLVRILALQEKGVTYENARTLAQAGFSADTEGLLASSQLVHNTLVAQQYALADQVSIRGSLNEMIRKGATEEEAAIHLAFARLSAMQKGLTAQQKDTKAKTLEHEKQKREMDAEAEILHNINRTVRNSIVMQRLLTGEVNAYTVALAKAKAANPDAKEESLQDLITAQAKNEIAMQLVENARLLNGLAKGYSSEQMNILEKYKVLGDLDKERALHAEKLNKILKERQEFVDNKKNNPIGDFSGVNFDVFGDLGNPLESALSGINEYLSKMDALSDKLKTVRQEQLDVGIAAEIALIKGGSGSAEYIATSSRLSELKETEKDYHKQKKSLQEDSYVRGLSIAKSLLKEESAGYKVLSAAEKAFTVFKLLQGAKRFAIEMGFITKETGAYVAGSLSKKAAELGFTAFTVVQKGIQAAASGVAALASSMAGLPFPLNIAAFAATGALLASIGLNLFGGGKASGSFAPTNEGTGTVFGDPTAKSESIKKSIDLLAENSDVTTPLTAAMLKSLQNIESNIGGLANLLIRNAPGSKLVEGVNQGFKQNSIGNTITKGTDVLNKMTFGLADTLSLGLFSSVGKLLGDLFGTEVSVKGQGLFGANQQLGDIVGEGFSLQEYVDVQTKKKSFGITTSKKNSTQYSATSQELEDQFTLIFKGFNDAILYAAPILDKNTNEVANKLNDFVVSIGRVDLKGLNGEQIQEKLNAVFGAEADKMAQAALGGLDDFQKVGEGYFETLVRVATSIEMATVYTDRLNVSAIKYTDVINKQGDVTTEIIRQSVLLNESNKDIKNGFYDLVNTFNGTAGEITDFVLTLRDLQDAIVATGKSGDYLTSAMLAGAGGLDRLQDGLEAYFEILSPAEQAAELTRRLTNEFAVFGTQVPASVDAFKALVNGIDINTEAGQKLYGQVVALTPEFVDLQDSLKKAEDAAKSKAEEARRLAEEAKKAAESLAKLRTAFFITGQDVSRLTQVMINAAGGVEAMQRGLDAMFEMLSPTEKAAELTRRLAIQFKALGLELPSSTDAFRVLVKEMNTSTNAGKALLGKVIALAPEFNELQKALESTNNEVNQLVQSLRDLAEQARQARGETEQPRNLDYARAMFESTAMLAMQGDTTAANKLLSLGNNLMDLSKQYSTSGSEYARDLAWIQRAATVSADVQEGGLGYTSTTLSTSLSGGNSAPTLATTSTSTDTEIKGLRLDLNAALLAIAKYTQSTANKLENWDDGNRVMVGVIQEIDDPKLKVVTT